MRQGAADLAFEAYVAKDLGWHLGLADIEALERRLRAPGRDGTTSFGAQIASDAIASAMRGLQWGAPPPTDFTVEFFSARREPEDLGEPVSEARGRRSTREERRLAELKRRLAYVYARS